MNERLWCLIIEQAGQRNAAADINIGYSGDLLDDLLRFFNNQQIGADMFMKSQLPENGRNSR